MILLLILAVVAGVLYRMGGSSKYHTLYRDIGVPLVAVGALSLGGGWHWTLIPSGLLLYGAMTTYWDKVNKWFGQSDAEYWLNWLLTGLAYSLAMLPYVIVTGAWGGFIIRSLLLPALFVLTDYMIDMYALNAGTSFDKAVPKERTRGFLTIVTLPLL